MIKVAVKHNITGKYIKIYGEKITISFNKNVNIQIQ